MNLNKDTILLDKTSLSTTIDRVSEALLFGLDMNREEKKEIAGFLITQHFEPGTYANMFAPTEKDMKQDLMLFTGERITSNAGRRHILGEEACRLLRKLDMKTAMAEKVIEEAREGIFKRIKESGSKPGHYCCRTCSCALWLNLTSAYSDNYNDFLKSGLDFLKKHREEQGTWKGFPYFYTLYALNEMDPKLAREELLFSSKSILRWIKRKPSKETKYTLRRYFIGESILNKIN